MKRAALAVAVLLSLCAAGCGTARPSAEAKLLHDHVLMFDSLGGAHDPVADNRRHYPDLIHPRSTEEFHAVPDFTDYDAYVDRLIDGIKEKKSELKAQNKPMKLLFYFHGGLNSRAAAIDRAVLDLAKIQADPGAQDVYPIFVNWQTSLYASFKDHLLWIHKGQNTYEKGASLWAFELIGDVARTVVEIPVANFLQWKDLARNWSYRREAAVQAETCSLDAPDLRQGPDRHPTRAQRFRTNLGAFPTYVLTKWWAAGLIDAAGSSAWSSMIYTAKRLFYSDQEMHHPYGYVQPRITGAGPLSRFLERLDSEKVLGPDDQIVLVAHSAGAVVANLIVANFGDRFPIKKLVYMAPACTVDELMPQGALSRFLSVHTDSQLYILTLHEQTELDEKFKFDLAPRGSLLVWLDEFIQPKNAEFGGLMMGRARTLRLHYHFIPCDIQPRIHVTEFGEEQAATGMMQPQRHGQFGELPYWREATWKPLDADIPGIEKVRFTHIPAEVPPPKNGQ